MRPLTVRTLCSSGPLFCRRLPVLGCCGGGESRLRGVEAELEGGLVGVVPEEGEQVADLLLAGVDDLSGGCSVDGVGDVLAESLELAPELFEERLGRELGLGVQGCLLAGTGAAAPGGTKEMVTRPCG
jgi:hypothetical protein